MRYENILRWLSEMARAPAKLGIARVDSDGGFRKGRFDPLLEFAEKLVCCEIASSLRRP